MLDSNLKTQLKSYLANLKSPIELHLAIEDGDEKKSQELSQLANDIAALSDKVSVRESNHEGARRPSMEVFSVEKQTRITFAGLPMGHEFTSLVLALLHSGGHPMKVEAQDVETVKNLTGPLRFETYVSLSCQTCPGVVQALNMMAAINPQITNTMIDGALFQDEVSERNIMAVPSVYLNDELFSQGAVSLSEILNKLDGTSAEKQAAQLAEKDVFDFLVVGGGPAGAAAAIYGARKGINTGVVADRFGGQVADTVGIENFISVTKTEGPKLVAGLEEHVRDYDVDIMNNNKAVSLSKKQFVEVELENGAVLKSRSVLLATGARWREMNVPGEQQYRGAGVAYCPHCDGPLFKGKAVAVIGGGNSGIEAAIDLAGIVEHVTVLEFDTRLRADEVLQKKAASMANIDIILNAQTTEVVGDGSKVTGLKYRDRASELIHEVSLAGVFVQIGLMPNSEWLKGSIDLTPRGEIITDERGQTSLAGVFAAGDVTHSPYKQIIIAMGSGASGALGAFDYLIRSSVEDESQQAD